MEHFGVYYTGDADERFMFGNRLDGPTSIAFWMMISCNVVVPQVLWLRGPRATS